MMVRGLLPSTMLLPLALLVSCSAGKSAPSNSAPGNSAPSKSEPVKPPPIPADDASRSVSSTDAAAANRGPVPEKTTQLIVSLSNGWQGTDATLYRFERELDGSWNSVGTPSASTIGHTGLGWGRGLHSSLPTEDMATEPVKREGDGRSPAGVFRIGKTYGYEKAPASAQLPFQKVTRSWRCVNDAESKHYNRVLNTKGVAVDWSEAEHMRRWDDLYELVIEVDHNHIVAKHGEPTGGDGSCIFLHVWRKPGAPTIGCTAMELAHMKSLLAWLTPKARPVFVALPAARYESLRAAWQLPQLPR